MSTVYGTSGNWMESSRIIVQLLSLQNQKHVTKSKAWPYYPENWKHYKIKNMAHGVI